MHAASTRTAQQRRLAAQSLIATRDRLPSIPSTLEVAPVVTPSNATIENLTVALESLLAAIRPATPAPVIVPAPTPVAVDPQAALRAQLVARLQAIPVAAAPAAAPAKAAKKAKVKMTWAELAKDKVVVDINAMGKPLNKHNMFVAKAEAIDPRGLIVKWDRQHRLLAAGCGACCRGCCA